ncbi:MAG: 2-oxoacid:acceptor oxidoreductase subunit alpha [Candidatus Binatia bacterium]
MGSTSGNLAVASSDAAGTATGREAVRVREHIVEVVSDSGEGAQKTGQAFGTVCAKMGNGAWTVEIIPAEIKPPARSREGASGIRIRFGSQTITNMGDQADLVVAFNEQVLYGRMNQTAYRKGTVVLLENKWGQSADDNVRRQYAEALEELAKREFVVLELPLEEACLPYTKDPRVGKNMFVLGMLCTIYRRDLDVAVREVEAAFAKKSAAVIETNVALLRGGAKFAAANVPYAFEVPPMALEDKLVVMNGNQAIGFGVMAAGMEMVAMYPITPATSASHYLAASFDKVGGFVHQAEDEIAAIGFALGASYAGKTACTITSGPGLALKTEFLGFAVMAEIPLVLVDVQRGGPSTGLPTKVEQSDLLAALYGETGDAPKIVIAPATIEECFQFVITARQLAESFRGPVMILSDANLATGVQPIPRPKPSEEWLAPPIDQSPWQKGVTAYDWDDETGLSPRPVPGQAGGEYVVTGLAHTREGRIAYDPASNQRGCEMRSRKFAALRATLKPPTVHGAPTGDLLVVGWGSTLGAIEEAVDRARAAGHAVSSVHPRFLYPLQPGLEEIFAGFKRVLTVELGYSDPPEGLMDGTQPPRPPQFNLHLRSMMRREIDYWSITPGQPLSPGQIQEVIIDRLKKTGVIAEAAA